jgi:hypothetical protein
MSEDMAKANKKDEAEEYFEQALPNESVWGYEDRQCAKVLEDATSQHLSVENINAIKEEYALSNDGFYYKCLQAHLLMNRGSVSWKPSKSLKPFLSNPFEDILDLEGGLLQ